MTERLRILDRCPARPQSLIIREVQPCERVRVLCLSDQPLWVPTHWDERQRRSVPCPAGCACGKSLARGFVHVVDQWRCQWVLAVGEEAGYRANAWLTEHGTTRLSCWIAWREGHTLRCPVRLWIEPPRRVFEPLPEDVDLADFVRRLYGLPEEALRPPKKMATGDDRRETLDEWRLIG